MIKFAYKKNGAPSKEDKAMVEKIKSKVDHLFKKGGNLYGVNDQNIQKILNPSTREDLIHLYENIDIHVSNSFGFKGATNNATTSGTTEPVNNSQVQNAAQNNQQSPVHNEKADPAHDATNTNPVPNEGDQKMEFKSDFADSFEDTPIEDYNPLDRYVHPKDYSSKNILQEIENKEKGIDAGPQNNGSVQNPNQQQVQQNQTQPPAKRIMKDIPTLEDRIKQNLQGDSKTSVNQNTTSPVTNQQQTTTPVTNGVPTPNGTTQPTPNMKDLPLAQKQRYAEKTADAMLNSYGKFIRGNFNPLKNWAKIDMKKVEKGHIEGKINLDMKLRLANNNMVTIHQYLLEKNQNVEETFQLTPQARKDIKEPLVDYLMENNFVLSSGQRLMIAVGEHVMGMVRASYVYAQQNKVDLAAFERYHKETMQKATELIEAREEKPMNQTSEQTTAPTTEQPSSQPTQQQERKEEKPVTTINDFLKKEKEKEETASKNSKKSDKKTPKKNGKRK